MTWRDEFCFKNAFAINCSSIVYWKCWLCFSFCKSLLWMTFIVTNQSVGWFEGTKGWGNAVFIDFYSKRDLRFENFWSEAWMHWTSKVRNWSFDGQRHRMVAAKPMNYSFLSPFFHIVNYPPLISNLIRICVQLIQLSN